MDWFLYDNGPRHERINIDCARRIPFGMVISSKLDLSEIKNELQMFSNFL